MVNSKTVLMALGVIVGMQSLHARSNTEVAKETNLEYHALDGQVVRHQKFDNNVFLEADFIYWNVGQEGNNYAADVGVLSDGTPTGTGEVYRPKYDMTPGFKIALGLDINKDEWDSVLRYTWLHPSKQSSTGTFNYQEVTDSNNTTTLESTLRNLFSVEGSALTVVNLATANSSIHFNGLDFEIGKNLYFSPWFTLRVFSGLKSVWVKEKLKIQYSALPIVNLIASNNKISYTQHQWGLGPRVGASTIWSFCNKHLEIFGDGAFTALWSRVKLNVSSYGTSEETNRVTGELLASNFNNRLLLDQKYYMHTLLPVFELAMGLQTQWFFEGGQRLLISGAWETQMFLFMIQHSSSIADLNLNMEGFTLKFRYDF